VLFYLLAQQQVDPIATTLPQYGAIGILALVGLVASVALWRRITAINDQERQRADRLEKALLDLNDHISKELSGHLVRATEAMREVTEMLRHRDRDRGGR
jgi:type VI protein secretion system component VasK